MIFKCSSDSAIVVEHRESGLVKPDCHFIRADMEFVSINGPDWFLYITMLAHYERNGPQVG